MPTNVTPQYRAAEERFRQATSPQQKVVALHEMLAVMPKHKGTDHLKARLRSQLSKLMEELEGSSRRPGGGKTDPFSLPKQGAGRATLVGPTNVGKSLILSKATGAHSRVGAYALSTLEPVPGMLDYEDVSIQLVDTPPISNLSTQGRLYGLLRTTDVLVIVVDLSLNPVSQVQETTAALEQWGFRLGYDEDGDSDDLAKPLVIVGNKADIPDSLENFQVLEEEFGSTYPVVMMSAEEEVGLEELGEEVFRALRVIRIYTKSPNEKIADFRKEAPFVLPKGSTVGHAAERVHKDVGRNLKYAVLWGVSGKFDGQHVGRDHQLHDRDVIELHV